MAVQDDLICKNPFGFELATVVVNDSVTREAITRAQERAFLKFIQEDNFFRLLLVVLASDLTSTGKISFSR